MKSFRPRDGSQCRQLSLLDTPSARFAKMSAMVLQGESITEEQLEEMNESLRTIVIVKEPERKTAKIIPFPAPTRPTLEVQEFAARLMLEGMLKSSDFDI